MRLHAMLLTASLFLNASVPAALAQTAKENPPNMRINVQSDMPAVGDFTVGPARMIMSLAPGEERTVDLEITNRGGVKASFSLETEDFMADPEREGTPTFFEDTTEGPFTARAWLHPEYDAFTLNHAERLYMRVTVKVPLTASAGDHQAAVIFTRDSGPSTAGGFNIVSRVAALFIITVEGDVVENGYVDRLNTRNFFNWSFPVVLQLSARNMGTVHMIPAGTIEIRNIFGIVVDEIAVKNWVILRDSSRVRDFEWRPKFALGYYRAETNLKVFNGQQLDPVRTGFIIIPILPVLILLLLIFLVSFLVQYFFARFEIRRKDDEKDTPKKKS